MRAEATDGVSFETDAPRDDSGNLREPRRKTKRRQRQENRDVRAQPVNGPTGEQLSSTVGQMVPSRPLSEEHDEEVAVHELQA